VVKENTLENDMLEIMEAYNAGFIAADEGGNYWDNPYNRETQDKLHNAWDDGCMDMINGRGNLYEQKKGNG